MRLFLLLGFILLFALQSFAEIEASVMPLQASLEALLEVPVLTIDQVKPKMRGYWLTVVDDNPQPQRFELIVVGIAHNFYAPGCHIIFCDALDPEQQKIGNVAGMSGSPVYLYHTNHEGVIEDRLIGAYALGHNSPKDQALFGVMPIEQMAKILQHNSGQTLSAQGLQSNSSSFRTLSPLTVHGIAPEILQHFDPHFRHCGFHLLQTGSSGNSNESTFYSEDEQPTHAPQCLEDFLQPGGAVGVALMSGDFANVAGIGTITWRKGNRLLAMGHPMFNKGALDVPLKHAKILTIVRHLDCSFKMGELYGPPLGSFYEDRMSGMAGKIGKMPSTIDFKIHVSGPFGEEQTFKAEVFRDRQLTPALIAMGIAQATFGSYNEAANQTYVLKTELKLKGHEPVTLHWAAAGEQAYFSMGEKMRALLQLLGDNPFEVPLIESVECQLSICPKVHQLELFGAQIPQHLHRIECGKPFEVNFTTFSYQESDHKQYQNHLVRFVLPKNALDKKSYKVQIATSSTAKETAEGPSPEKGFRSLEDLLAYLRKQRSPDAFYAQLLAYRPGSVRFQNYFSHPLSRATALQYQLNAPSMPIATSNWEVIEEQIIPCGKLCAGAPLQLFFE